MVAASNMRVLWWGRHGNYGPDYPRNRTMMHCMQSLGWELVEFQPRVSPLGQLEARQRRFVDISMVWVPCFRQRDLKAASRWAKRRGIPLVFDPLISAYDKRVNERQKYDPGSKKAQKLLRWERDLFSRADVVVADTRCHQSYFVDVLGCDDAQITVIPVSAEETLFYPVVKSPATLPEVLFFGTFIGLQGPAYIAQAIGFYDGPPICLTFLGRGPERERCEGLVKRANNPKVSVTFEDWVPFADLAERIRRSDICLGIFGTGEKSFRVIPNKVYQALACGKPIVTMRGDAYPQMQADAAGAIYWTGAGNSEEIAQQIRRAVEDLLQQPSSNERPRELYDRHFSNSFVKKKLLEIEKRLFVVDS